MLEVRDIYKQYEGKPLLEGVSFSMESGQIVCLLGESGSGKSTLLRIIAGLETAEKGTVAWNGRVIDAVPAHQRQFGLMFQDYALFPHRSVAQNVAFGLRMQNLPAEVVAQKTQKALETIRMSAFAKRPVTELSGGEQQRVALARALAPSPNLLMLDEPLGALDHGLRVQLIQELRRVLHQTGTPAIYVTHDREEAFALADRLLILHDGRIVQEGSAQDLFEAPVNAWVARFLGLGNLVAGTVLDDNPPRVQTDLGIFDLAALPAGAVVGDTVWLLLRPKAFRIGEAESGLPNQFAVEIEDCVFMGDFYRLSGTSGGQRLELHCQAACSPGQTLLVHFPAENMLCLQ